MLSCDGEIVEGVEFAEAVPFTSASLEAIGVEDVHCFSPSAEINYSFYLTIIIYTFYSIYLFDFLSKDLLEFIFLNLSNKFDGLHDT